MPYDYRNKYGADLVYSEEIIDHRMIRAKRTYNPHLHSVDFVQPDGTVIFRTCPAERGKLVFQMGTADPARAVAVARLVMHDVLAVDVNMGCPKSYSTDGGMGAALLKHPDKIHAILTALVAAVGEHVHVTCKIRVLATVEETVALAKMIESTGVSALAVHCRLTHERPREPGHPDMLKPIVDALSIPVIANGGSLDIVSHDDIEAFRQRTGCASVMVARAAQNNPSVFRPEPLVPRLEMARQLLRTGIEWDNPSGNTKFCINTLANDGSWVTPHGFTQCESHAAMCPFLGIDPAEVVAIQERRRAAAVLERERDGDLVVVVGGGAHSSAPTAKRNLQRANSSEEASGDATSLVTDETENASKRMRMDAADPTPTNVDPLLHETNTIHMPLIFLSDTIVRPQPYPKALVDILANRPQFTTDEANRMFRVRLVEPETGTQFCSSLFDKRKKVSEHAAALVYLLHRHPTEAAQFAQSYKLRGDDEHKQFVFQNDAPVVSESTPAAI
ncbi:tRNA dihydrouridine synthase Dus2 [Capsaspora owczarzaki ATCC 30864]|uniref:tRNA dihydrouridine synthase Dus2 n=1 Tax=Capsaspora owczarzaki (strain ATCC 30864) TaxID=595528 RepID=UPI0001FE54A8|nr:tRNA dihydrouridine synthase Dus2 [Capsaspora owczarzaki ATCC 30864]|eukprot:XP_004343266.1 tRNA dihydrouridine synthase Dus2 [Capsaspora owczarzaki ATCC 30864]